MPIARFLTESAEEVYLENGLYDAIWGGYEIFEIENYPEIKFKTKEGVRTPRFPVTIDVKNNHATVYTLITRIER